MIVIRRRLRPFVTVVLLGSGALAAAAVNAHPGQPAPTAGETALADAVRGRFEVAMLLDGLALTPNDPSVSARMIQIGDGVVAVDGEPVAGRELRDLLGDDADLVLRLTYLDEPARRALFGDAAGARGAAIPGVAAAPGAPASAATAPDATTAGAAARGAPAPDVAASGAAAPDARAVSGAATAVEERDERSPGGVDDDPPRRTSRQDVFRLGGSVTVDRDERIRGDVAVIGGSLTVDGEVTGDVVVIGGTARFGPEASVRGAVTVIGGSLRRAPTSTLRQGVTHIAVARFNPFARMNDWIPDLWPFARHDSRLSGGGDLAGTAMRLFFLALIASLAFLLARGPVERVARRTRAEPIKAGLVGLLAQVLFVPVLVVGIVLLVISLVGIPLLFFLPFVMVAIAVVLVFGFTGVVLGLGDLVRGRMGATGPATYVSVWAGIAIILVPTLAGEAMEEVAGGVFTGLGVLFVLTGLFVEYAAWTAGLGALLLNRFGSPLPPPPLPPPPSPEPDPAPPDVPEPPPDVAGAPSPDVPEPPPDVAGAPSPDVPEPPSDPPRDRPID